MAAKKISQAEARRLRKMVKSLAAERAGLLNRLGWVHPGECIAGFDIISTPEQKGAIKTAMKLGYVLTAKFNGTSLNIHAVKP